jgi:hypothetical protein
MKRSARGHNLSSLAEASDETKTYTSASGNKSINFPKGRADKAQATSSDPTYDIHELIHEHVGGNSKTGLDNIGADADLHDIYSQVLGDYKLKPRVAAPAPKAKKPWWKFW